MNDRFPARDNARHEAFATSRQAIASAYQAELDAAYAWYRAYLRVEIAEKDLAKALSERAAAIETYRQAHLAREKAEGRQSFDEPTGLVVHSF